ncbi:MAG: KpsF/GutQ family sugar-phosphate isomerase [Planctomycetaceae bacterium]|jgi:arabinose-5-phosphate isomerase|nr:KpsF/GutQ family sugar-phosphate isomerase [Planctomycetaceae bacterium]
MADVLSLGKQILRQEARSIQELADNLDARFLQAVYRILCCEGNIVVCGIGKAGLVGQKVSATLSSTGSPSHFLHPAEAIHGDLGKIKAGDVLLIFSQSGETEEITRILPALRSFRISIMAVTASENSTLGKNAEIVLPLGNLTEADVHGLAPSTSTAAMIALGDALALTVSERRRFQADHFAKLHPGGSLGRKLSLVDEHMRHLDRCRLAPDSETIREVFARHCISGRRSGAVLLTDIAGRLSGIFTDSDLARLFEKGNEHLLDSPIRHVMTLKPAAVMTGTKMLEAVAMMGERRISELPVTDGAGFPIGILDITDIVAAFPECAEQTMPQETKPVLKAVA